MEKLRVFEIHGKFLEKRNEKKFTKTISAGNENLAREKLFAFLGSNQGIKRRHIFIKEIKEVKSNG